MKLDKKNKQLLYHLTENARYSNVELGKKIRLSKDAVAYRINKLEEQRIIRNYKAQINYQKLGYETYRIGLHLINFDQTQEEQLLNYLQTKPSIWGISVNEGVWTVSYMTTIKTLTQLYTTDQDILKQFRHIIAKRHVTPITHTDFLPKTYLIEQNHPRTPKTIHPTTPEQLDELDKQLLTKLQQNAKAQLIELAEELNCSSSLVLQRMRRLEEKNIILRYAATLDVLQLGRDYYGVKIILNNREEYESLQQHIYNIPEMTGYLYALGDYDLEFDLEVQDTKHYRKIINEIKKHYKTIREVTYLKTNKYIIRELPMK